MRNVFNLRRTATVRAAAITEKTVVDLATAGLGTVGCSPDKTMLESVDQFVAREADSYTMTKPRAAREFYVNESQWSLYGTAPTTRKI